MEHERPQLTPEQWAKLRKLEHQLEQLHCRFNRVRSPERQWWDRQSPNGGRGIIYEDEAVSLGVIMREVSKVLDELEVLEGKVTTHAVHMFDDVMKRINDQRRDDRQKERRRRRTA